MTVHIPLQSEPMLPIDGLARPSSMFPAALAIRTCTSSVRQSDIRISNVHTTLPDGEMGISSSSCRS